MTRPDSASWTAAKAQGDSAELALAAWWRGLGFTAHKSIGQADHDLRITADVEVKHDLQASITGHVAVEVSYAGRPSGIITSRATFWAIVIGGEALVARTEALRRLALRSQWREVDAGDGRLSRVRLVAVEAVRALERIRVVRLEGAP